MLLRSQFDPHSLCYENVCKKSTLRIFDFPVGAYGVVDRMRHNESGIEMAVKRIRHTVNTQEQTRLLMDLDVTMRSSAYPYTIDFYGALYQVILIVFYFLIFFCSFHNSPQMSQNAQSTTWTEMIRN